MPLKLLEESIIGDAVVDDVSGIGILQRRINLPKGKKFSVEFIDIFDDNGSVGQAIAGEGVYPTAVVYYISPYPIQLSDMPWGNVGFTNVRQGPNAGDGQILFKKIGINQKEPDGDLWVWSQYPSAQIAARKTEEWFSPHLYVTALFYSQPPESYDFNFSVSIGVNMTRTSILRSTIENYREFRDAQMRLMANTSVNIPLDRWVGQTYPMWTMGGIRPELVMGATDMLTYFSDSELLNPETASSRAALQAQFIASQTAVAFDAAFGSTALELPVWLEITASGIATGPIRQQWPPNKYADNGNTLTF